MLEKLKARKAELARLREERGATDPILIIAGIAITLILLVGGSFAISGFIGNAHNLNAKGDLDRVATAQAAYLAERDTYAADAGTLASSSVGFTPTAGNKVEMVTSPSGWVAVTKSASGEKFLRASTASGTVDVATATPPTYSSWSLSRLNNATNPLGPGPKSAAGYVSANSSTVAPVAEGLAISRNTQPGSGTAVVSFADAVAYSSPGTYSLSADVTNTASTSTTYELYVSGVWVPSARSGGTLTLAPGETGRLKMDVALTGTTKGLLHVRRSSNTAETSMVLSNVLFERGSGLYSFFDGNSSGSAMTRYVWSGAAGASVSRAETRTVRTESSIPDVTLPDGISWSQVNTAIAALD